MLSELIETKQRLIATRTLGQASRARVQEAPVSLRHFKLRGGILHGTAQLPSDRNFLCLKHAHGVAPDSDFRTRRHNADFSRQLVRKGSGVVPQGARSGRDGCRLDGRVASETPHLLLVLRPVCPSQSAGLE